jgi:asparagine synthase (glutamine-hydrolysing)
VDTQAPKALLKDVYDHALADNIINKMSALDLKITLSDNDLPKVSAMCEAAGMLVAYPFMNDRLVEFSARLPPSLKVKNLRLRYFFKEALREFLPKQIISKRKHGFGLPFGAWLLSHRNLREFSFDAMHDLKQRNIVRPEFIDELLDRKIAEHPNFFGSYVWVLLILELWLAQNAQDWS